jgi:starvation-inducible DNA-binding protein
MNAKKIRTAAAPSINIGISADERETIAKGLSALLADSYTLYLMTHNFHWNVTGTDVQHPAPDVHGAIHGTVERARHHRRADSRTRSSRLPAPTRSSVKIASIKEVEGVPKATDMIRHLVAAQEATARTARELFPVVNAANDQPTADLLTQRLEVHEKTAWMLRSLLEE